MRAEMRRAHPPRRSQSLPWQCLNFSPEPQGQASLRDGEPQVLGSFSSKPGAGDGAVGAGAPAVGAEV